MEIRSAVSAAADLPGCGNTSRSRTGEPVRTPVVDGGGGQGLGHQLVGSGRMKVRAHGHASFLVGTVTSLTTASFSCREMAAEELTLPVAKSGLKHC